MADLDEAIAFYRETFGMRCVHEEINEDQGVREAMLAVGDGATRIAAARPAVSRDVADRAIPRPQRARACSRSPTPSTTSTRPPPRCASAACACSTTSRGAAPPDSRINFVHPKDAGGVLVELVEPAS